MPNKIRSLLRLSALLTLVALSLAPKVAAQRIKQPLPTSLDNLHEVNLVEIKSAAGQVVLSGTFSKKSETNREIEREALLTSPTGDATAKGLAEIEIEQSGAPAKKELEMKLEDLPASTSFTLFVDGKEILVFKTNSRGNADLKLSTAIKK